MSAALVQGIQVVAGIALLAFGGEVLVRGAASIAGRLGIRPAVIGLTVVAVGTSMPELVVSLIAAFTGRADLAVANVVGSNLFNIGVILGLAALIRPLAVHSSAVRSEWPMLMVVTLGAVFAFVNGVVGRLEGALLLLALVLFTAWLVRDAARAEASELAPTASAQWDRPLRASGLIVFGLALLAFGAHVLVEGAVGIALGLGWSERVVGLTVVAAGTSMPELAATLAAARRGALDMALGNVLGSNLFNLAGILGVVAVVLPQQVAPAVMTFDAWWLLAFTVALFPLMRSGWRINRVEGALLVAAYLVYLALVLR